MTAKWIEDAASEITMDLASELGNHTKEVAIIIARHAEPLTEVFEAAEDVQYSRGSMIAMSHLCEALHKAKEVL